MGMLLLFLPVLWSLKVALDSSISKQLVDKMYEKRKAAALELEKYLSRAFEGCHSVANITVYA